MNTFHTIPELFEAQVTRAPDATAVTQMNHSLTYGELNRRINRLARYLVERGVEPEYRVALCLGRSLETVVGMMAVTKAGACCVPLDPRYPQDRLAFMARDSFTSLALSQGTAAPGLCEQLPACVDLHAERTNIAAVSPESVEIPGEPDNLAYVFYTSGSTGRPNSVLVTRGAVSHLIETAIRAFRVDGTSRVLNFASTSYANWVLESLMALCAGANLCIGTQEALQPGPRLHAFLRDSEVTTAILSPSALVALPLEPLPALATLAIGGEACPMSLVRKWAQDHRFLNIYGSTETFALTVGRIDDFSRPVSVGSPIGETHIHVLREHTRTLTAAASGELLVAGPGLARGYSNRPAATAAKFAPDPCGEKPGGRVYRTGDLARISPDGQLELLGRVDRQVSIRGVRIEPEEIETVLNQHPSVKQAVVVKRDDLPGDPQLIAYVVVTPDRAPAIRELRRYLEKALPTAMVPNLFYRMDAFPLTPNGKIDCRALPLPDTARPELDHESILPRTPVEETLARIWAAVLRLDHVGVDDDFFELGGHSLKAARLFIKIEEHFGKNLPVSSLLESPTIATLARKIQQPADAPSSLVAIRSHGEKRPFFLVHPHSGNVIHFRELAGHLSTEQPLYGLQARGLDGHEEPHGSIEAMATDYIAEIRRIQADGPYLLGGHCVGGTIAFEMAQQLHAADEEVSLLALFDAPPPAGIFERSLTYYFQRVRYHLGRNPMRLATYVREYLRQSVIRFRVAPFDVGRKSAPLRALATIERTNMLVRGDYVAQRYPGRITCLWSDELAQLEEMRQGWATLAEGGVDSRVIPGTSPDLFTAPCVEQLAWELSTVIDDSCRGPSRETKPGIARFPKIPTAE